MTRANPFWKSISRIMAIFIIPMLTPFIFLILFIPSTTCTRSSKLHVCGIPSIVLMAENPSVFPEIIRFANPIMRLTKAIITQKSQAKGKQDDSSREDPPSRKFILIPASNICVLLLLPFIYDSSMIT